MVSVVTRSTQCRVGAFSLCLPGLAALAIASVPARPQGTQRGNLPPALARPIVAMALRHLKAFDALAERDGNKPTNYSRSNFAMEPVRVADDAVLVEKALGIALAWDVHFGVDGPVIGLAAATRHMTYFEDRELQERLGPLGPAEPVLCIPADAAIRTAQDYLAASGAAASQFGLLSAHLEDRQIPASRASRLWSVQFSRLVDGVPFATDGGAQADVDATGGRLLRIAIQRDLPAPQMRLRVPMEAAISLARRFTMSPEAQRLLPEKSPHISGSSTAGLYIVRPTYWRRGDAYPIGRQTRLAWVVRTPFNDEMPGGWLNPRWTDVDIDAWSGAVIAAENDGLRSGKRVQAGTQGGAIGKRVRGARKLVTRHLQGTARWQTLDALKTPVAFYGAVSAMHGASGRTGAFHPNMQLTAISASGIKTTFWYDSIANLLAASRSGATGLVCGGPALQHWASDGRRSSRVGALKRDALGPWR